MVTQCVLLCYGYVVGIHLICLIHLIPWLVHSKMEDSEDRSSKWLRRSDRSDLYRHVLACLPKRYRKTFVYHQKKKMLVFIVGPLLWSAGSFHQVSFIVLVPPVGLFPVETHST